MESWSVEVESIAILQHSTTPILRPHDTLFTTDKLKHERANTSGGNLLRRHHLARRTIEPMGIEHAYVNDATGR